MRYAMLILLIAVFVSATAAQQQQTPDKNNTPSRAARDYARLTISDAETAEASSNALSEVVNLNNSGVAVALQGNYQEAVGKFRLAISKAKRSPQIYFNLAMALSNDKQYDEAIKVFKKLIEISPYYANAYAGLGEALYRNGAAATESVVNFRRALELNPTDVITMLNLGSSLYAEKQFKESFELLDAAVKLQPDFAKALNNRGTALFALNRKKEAIADFRQAIVAEPNFAESYNNLGVVLDNIGKKKEARRAFLKAVELRPDWNYAVYNLAVSFLNEDNRAAAQKQLNALDKIDTRLASELRDLLWQKYVVKIS